MDHWQEPCSFCLERWLEKSRILYLAVAVLAGVLLVAVVWGFSRLLFWLPWDKFTISVAVAMGVCLSCQLIGIPWFLSRMRTAFSSTMFPRGGSVDVVSPLFEDRLCSPGPYYATVAFVMLPFVLLYIGQSFKTGGTPFFAAEHTAAAFVFDIFNLLTGFSLLFLLAVILWMILVVAWTLFDAQGDPERRKIPVEILAPDGVGGLGSVQALVRSLLTYYFIIVALLVISYLSPTHLWSYEALFVIALFIAGILFFFLGFGAIRNIVRGKVADEMQGLNDRIRSYYRRFMDIMADEDRTDVKMLENVESILDACHAERNRMMAIYEKNTAFDIRTVAQSVASILIPLLVFIEQVASGMDAIRVILPGLGL